MPCHPDRVRRNAEPPAFPEDPRAPNVAPKVDALVESLSGWFDGYYFDPRKFQHEDIVYVHPGRLGVITSIGCPPPLSADDAFWHASTDTPYPPPWYTPPSSRDSDPCVETVDDFLISYIKSDPKTWAPQNPHYVKNHESAPGTVRQWFRAMRAADFARAVDLEIDYTREGHIYGEVAWKHREPWTLFDTQAVVDRETAAHYLTSDTATIWFLQDGRVAGRIDNVAIERAAYPPLSGDVDSVRLLALWRELNVLAETNAKAADVVHASRLSQTLRKDVLDFLEFIIAETGMSTDPEALASVICRDAVKLRDAIEANLLRGDPASPGAGHGPTTT